MTRPIADRKIDKKIASVQMRTVLSLFPEQYSVTTIHSTGTVSGMRSNLERRNCVSDMQIRHHFICLCTILVSGVSWNSPPIDARG